MLIVIDLRVDIHDNDQVVLGVIADGNADNILPANVNNMLDDLGLLLKLICPYCFLLVSFYVLHYDRATTEVDESRLGDK